MIKFIIWFLEFSYKIKNINLLHDLIGNWKNKMSGSLAMPLLYKMFDIFNKFKKKKYFNQFKINLNNFNNIFYNALLIYEELDYKCDGEITKNNAYIGYKKIFRLYNNLFPNNKQLSIFRNKLIINKNYTFKEWIYLITDKKLLNSKLYSIFDKFIKKEIILCQRCNGLMYLKKRIFVIIVLMKFFVISVLKKLINLY